MAAPGLRSNLRSLTTEFKSLAAGHWTLFCQEIAGKATHTRQQSIRIAAGGLTAFTALLLLLAGCILLMSQALVTRAGWQPLDAAGASALLLTLLTSLAGWLVFRRSGRRLRAESLTPEVTLRTLKHTAAALTHQPVTSVPVPPLTLYPLPSPMNTRQNFQNTLHQTADTVETQARRVGQAMQDTADSISRNFDPGVFFRAALAWVDTVLTPRNRALAGRALGAAAAFPRRHPVPSALLGLGALYVAWQRAKGTPSRDRIEEYAHSKVEAVKDRLEETRRYAANGFSAAAAAGRDLRESIHSTAATMAEEGRAAASQFGKSTTATADSVREAYGCARDSVAEGVDGAAETVRQIREDAEAGYRKAREFAKEEPALVIAGGVALALGALLLVKSSRR
jgi:hypothetical protein